MLQEISIDSIELDPFATIGKDTMLITATSAKGWNTMTASWGFAGVMWGKNAIATVIRPQRYTKEFMDKSEYFSVCFFGEEYKKALAFCGAHSVRDFDKAKETGLVPLFTDGSTIFEQASVAFAYIVGGAIVKQGIIFICLHRKNICQKRELDL